MKIEPIKGAVINCHHQPGDPDCDCYPECPECGESYDPESGHTCDDSDFDDIEENGSWICATGRY